MKRRAFLETTGALVVSFGAASLADRVGLAQGQFGTRASHIDPAQLDSTLLYLVSPASDAVTGTCVRVDDGQGRR